MKKYHDKETQRLLNEADDILSSLVFLQEAKRQAQAEKEDTTSSLATETEASTQSAKIENVAAIEPDRENTATPSPDRESVATPESDKESITIPSPDKESAATTAPELADGATTPVEKSITPQQYTDSEDEATKSQATELSAVQEEADDNVEPVKAEGYIPRVTFPTEKSEEEETGAAIPIRVPRREIKVEAVEIPDEEKIESVEGLLEFGQWRAAVFLFVALVWTEFVTRILIPEAVLVPGVNSWLSVLAISCIGAGLFYGKRKWVTTLGFGIILAGHGLLAILEMLCLSLTGRVAVWGDLLKTIATGVKEEQVGPWQIIGMCMLVVPVCVWIFGRIRLKEYEQKRDWGWSFIYVAIGLFFGVIMGVSLELSSGDANSLYDVFYSRGSDLTESIHRLGVSVTHLAELLRQVKDILQIL